MEKEKRVIHRDNIIKIMKKIYILFILSLCDPFAFGQQSAMLEKYRSMALEYSHDLKAAEKNP